jgi:hypothetical protein
MPMSMSMRVCGYSSNSSLCVRLRLSLSLRLLLHLEPRAPPLPHLFELYNKKEEKESRRQHLHVNSKFNPIKSQSNQNQPSTSDKIRSRRNLNEKKFKAVKATIIQ